MNSYYHSFTIGFNFWMLYAPLSMLIMFWLGSKQYRRENGKIRKVYGDRLIKIISVVFAISFAAMLMSESALGIIQVIDNSLGADDSGAWSILFAPLLVAVVGSLFYAIISYLGFLGSQWGLKRLKRRRRKRKPNSIPRV